MKIAMYNGQPIPGKSAVRGPKRLALGVSIFNVVNPGQ